jgi:hypothetical protein
MAVAIVSSFAVLAFVTGRKPSQRSRPQGVEATMPAALPVEFVAAPATAWKPLQAATGSGRGGEAASGKKGA